VSIIQLLDELPPSIMQPSGRLWNVLARSLGEQGADGRTALAWRWALTGTCPSPITLSPAPGWPPDSAEIEAEAAAAAELSDPRNDRGGQVMHARLVLEWLVGARDTLPLWNAGPGWPHVTDGIEHPLAPSEVEELLPGPEWRADVTRGRMTRMTARLGAPAAGPTVRNSFSPGLVVRLPTALDWPAYRWAAYLVRDLC